MAAIVGPVKRKAGAGLTPAVPFPFANKEDGIRPLAPVLDKAPPDAGFGGRDVLRLPVKQGWRKKAFGTACRWRSILVRLFQRDKQQLSLSRIVPQDPGLRQMERALFVKEPVGGNDLSEQICRVVCQGNLTIGVQRIGVQRI